MSVSGLRGTLSLRSEKTHCMTTSRHAASNDFESGESNHGMSIRMKELVKTCTVLLIVGLGFLLAGEAGWLRP